ncbi:hypothetical protein Cgig2_001853 [Carnegiea gigantea]|uniref:Uncharacterized protein n=1 Tax=Carnegiea gigantea TaxID=171969 RepID=A0A9Q1JZD9_9CARY|nr:hypothetical protein Cgig2_001853 [Carnegiea gigantea]
MDKFLHSLSRKSKLLHLTLSLFFLFLHLLRSLVFSLSSCSYTTVNHDVIAAADHHHHHHHHKSPVLTAGESSAIGRALRQLLSLLGEIPVSSRKYDVVRSLVEKLIHENLNEDSPALRDVNCTVLSEAFSRTLSQLEATMLDSRRMWRLRTGLGEYGPAWAVRAARCLYAAASSGGGANEGGVLPEKMAAELVWLAEKLDESGGVSVVVEKWASASGLGWAALMAEARRLKDKGIKQETEGREEEQQKQTKLKMLMAWLPLLCRAGTGADAPTLSSSEREEIERALEGIIDVLEEEENQERALSLWLHHFTHCPSSDWPNLYGSYIRWCTNSRKLLLTQ